MLIAVNYHYVRPSYDTPFPGIYGVTPSQLESQLEILGQHGVFVSGQQIREAISSQKSLPEKSILVTFDDGLKEHHEYALPVLSRLGIPALFFINTGPIVDGKVSSVHKIHLLRSQVAPQAFMDILKASTRKLERDIDFRPGNGDSSGQYPYDEPDVASLKYALNFLLTPSEKDLIVDACFSQVFDGREAEMSQCLYLSPQQISELGRRGFVGSHAHEHLPLGLISQSHAEELIRLSVCHIKKWTGYGPFAMSYPFGGESSCSPEVGRLAAGQGIEFAFTMERAGNQDLDLPLHLARYDCNDLPGGKTPQFEPWKLFDVIPSATWYRV
jgi:peptidoglycan/xylan/chitin deacetylase (PgdA/CDA1 family)